MVSRHSPPRPAQFLALVVVVVAGLVLVPAASHATPIPVSPAVAPSPAPSATEARRMHAALAAKMSKATEDFNHAGVLLARGKAQEKVLRGQSAAQQARVRVYEAEVADFAASAYRGGRIDLVTALLQSGSPQVFLDQMSTLENLSREQRAKLNRLIAAKTVLDQQQKKIASALAAQRQNQQTINTRRAAIQKDLKAWAALDAKLNPRASRSTRYGGGYYTGPASGRAKVALQAAFDQMGKPYQWGAEGPNSFDCSGLTSYVWRKAGVSIPRSSRAQYADGRKVSRASLQPGDLVYFGSPISHVAIVVSGDQVIGAPQTGDVVKYQSISRMNKPYAGATRP